MRVYQGACVTAAAKPSKVCAWGLGGRELRMLVRVEGVPVKCHAEQKRIEAAQSRVDSDLAWERKWTRLKRSGPEGK